MPGTRVQGRDGAMAEMKEEKRRKRRRDARNKSTRKKKRDDRQRTRAQGALDSERKYTGTCDAWQRTRVLRPLDSERQVLWSLGSEPLAGSERREYCGP